MIKNIAFDSGFLQDALEYWNPNTYCFKFGSNKISPLPEEFCAVLGFPSRVLVALPSLTEYYYKDFEQYFNLHTPLLTRIVRDQEVDLYQFAHLFCHLPISESFQAYKRRACLIS